MQQSADTDRKSLHKSITRGHLKPGVLVSQFVIQLIIYFYPSFSTLCRPGHFDSFLVCDVALATTASYQFSLRRLRPKEGRGGVQWRL